jgi:tRNA-specific 2-thiouridylase
VLDYESRFKEAVIDGSPTAILPAKRRSPASRCNQTVKFRDLLATAKDLGADAWRPATTCVPSTGNKRGELHPPADLGRDQSYFLFATTQEQLDFLRFPLGGLPKARPAPLPNANTALPSPTSPTARTSASCRTATMPR